MNSDKLWILKLIAWFHDPPDKMLELQGNEGRTLKSLEQLIGADAFRAIFRTDASQLQSRSRRESELKDIDEWKRAKKADQIAAAMDRSAAFPGALQFLDWANSPQLHHPLSGRELDLGALDLTGVAEAIEKVIDEIKTTATDAKSRYLLLWRMMQSLLSERNESSLKANWDLLPADSRIVDHSIWDHLGATSAVAGALPQPALLVFGIGPVQDFIATARRTQDLWMGSYILSYLSWQGMKVIADQFGPDVMLYPSLRRQPLVDHWLKNEMNLPIEPPSDESLTRATLPNKFVALLPNDKAEDAAKAVEQAIKDAWKKLADKVAQWLVNDLKIPADALWLDLWNEQVSQIPECYWSVHHWSDTRQFTKSKDEAIEALKQCSNLLSYPPGNSFDSSFEVFIKTAPNLVNIGTAYSRLHELAQHGFEARKTMRDFKLAAEEGAKCTMCGQRAALRAAKLSAREFWAKTGCQLRRRNDLGLYVAIKPEGHERLCGICTVKRFVQRAYFEGDEVLGLRGGFPSTSSVAAASFKDHVLEKLCEPELEEKKRKALIGSLQAHLDALEGLNFYQIKAKTGERMLPRLSVLRDKLPVNLQGMARDFIHYDGAAFYEETFTADRLEKDYGLDDVDEGLVNAARSSLRRLIAVCRELKIAPPAKYFAILKFDGDRIRDWLSGRKAPTFADALHPEARKMLQSRDWEDGQGRKQWESLADRRTREGHPITADELHSDWQKFLEGNRFLSPALHASLSRALANFALELAPFVVEQRYCGRIVYAGGDDLLALLPLDQVLPAARELRAFYSGQVGGVAVRLKDPDREVDVRLTNTDLAGYVEFGGEKLMTMGTAATASIGVSLAHHLSPLDKALEAARHAEDYAKKVFGFDTPTNTNYRDALSVIFLRRSGEEIRVGARWNYVSLPIDTFDLLAGLQRDFAEDRLSMKFAHAVYDQARVLAGSKRQPETEIPDAAREAALRRLLIRQRGAEIKSREEAKDQARILAPQLARLAGELQAHCKSDDPSADEAQPGMVQLAQWLQITRFLAQGGDD